MAASTTTWSTYGASWRITAIHEDEEGTVWFPLKDNLGSTRVMLKTEPAGGGARTVRPASVTDHLPFGGPMRVYGAGAGRFGFTGQEYDAETDLYNYKARLYSTDTGLFLGPDPAGQFHSPYVGMGNNPVNYVDPDGEWVLLAASYAWKAYRTYQTARTAYQVYQAFDKGGFEAGLGALAQLGASMIVSNQVGSFQNDLYQPRSLFTSMLSSGVRNAVTSSIMSGMYDKGDFAAGFSWKSFGSGMLDAAGGYVENAYAEHRYWKGSGQSGGLPNYHALTDEQRGEHVLKYLEGLQYDEVHDVKNIFDFYDPYTKRYRGPTPSISPGSGSVKWNTNINSISIPMEMYFNVTGHMINNRELSNFVTIFGFSDRRSHSGYLLSLTNSRGDNHTIQFKFYDVRHASIFANKYYFNGQIIPSKLKNY